jgi:general secretion pathway protein M
MIGVWRNLSARERGLIACGGYVIFVTALFLLFVEPIYQDLSAAHEHLEREAVITLELEGKAREAQTLRKRAEAPRGRPSSQSLFALVNATAGDAGVGSTIVRITARGEDEVGLVVDKVSFAELVAWLIVIAAELGIEVSQASVSRQGVPGLVTGNLTLVKRGWRDAYSK